MSESRRGPWRREPAPRYLFRCQSWQNALERTNQHLVEHTGLRVGIGMCPGRRLVQRREFRNDQAPGETGRAGIRAVDGGQGTGQQQAPCIAQGLQARARCSGRTARRRSRLSGASWPRIMYSMKVSLGWVLTCSEYTSLPGACWYDKGLHKPSHGFRHERHQRPS